MLSSSPLRLHVRQSHDLMYKGVGKTNSGFKQPYHLWVWKQNELFRNVMEYQFEHLRKVYKRQWYESYRLNADEYIYKYNITKAAQLAQWETEMKQQDATRRDALEMSSARKALREKHRDILKEYNEREFFRWFERASERLQYMSKIKFVKKEDLDSHVEAELSKYVKMPGAFKSYPLNFVGQMPLLETPNLDVAAVPRHLAQQHRAQFPNSRVEFYDPPVSDGQGGLASAATGEGGAAEDISAEVYNIDDAVSIAVRDAMAVEQEATEKLRTGGDAEIESPGDKDRAVNAMKHKLRGKVGLPKALLKRRLEQQEADGATEQPTSRANRRGGKKASRSTVAAVEEMLSPEQLADAARGLKGAKAKAGGTSTSKASEGSSPRKGQVLEKVQKLADVTETKDQAQVDAALRRLADATGTGDRYVAPEGLGKSAGPNITRSKPREVVDADDAPKS